MHYEKVIFEAVPAAMGSRSDDPDTQILHLFDIKRDEFKSGNFQGCLAINAKLEFQDKDAAIEQACSAFYDKFEAFVAALCLKGGHRNPKKLAREIVILFEGAIVLGQIHNDPAVPAMAKDMARRLLSQDH